MGAFIATFVTATACQTNRPAQQSSSGFYQNDEFQIAMRVPAGAYLCPTLESQHDHGPVMLLGSSTSKDCSHVENARAITIFAGYNAADVSKTLPAFLDWRCSHLLRSCLAPPEDLMLNDRASLAAMQRGPNGWIDVIVLTQGGKPDPEFDPRVPSINYTIRLHTKKEFLQRDLQTFKAVLRTVRLPS
jgi:hypothetical protein